MGVDRYPREKCYKFESIVLLTVFAVSWVGYGKYMSAVLLLAFFVALFTKAGRRFIGFSLTDRPLIILLALFTLSSVVSSLLSVKKVESSVLSVLWFALIFIPTAYARFAVNEKNLLFHRVIVPVGIVIALVVTLYLGSRFVHGLFTTGLTIKRYTFPTLGKASTPDILVMLGGLGYGWFRQRGTEKDKWLGFIYLLLCITGVVLSYDRGGVLSLFVLTVIVLSFDVKRLGVFLVLIGILIFLSFHVESLRKSQQLFEYLYSKKSQQRLVTHTQFATFSAAWGMIKDHWLTGVGTNNFSRFVRQYGTGRWYAYAHNFVLQFWAENGLFGMLFGVSILGLFIYRWLRSLRLHRYKYVALGAGASFIGMLVGNLTNSTIWILKISVPFWLLAGVINAMYFLGREESGELKDEVTSR